MTYAQQRLIHRGRFAFDQSLQTVPMNTSIKAIKGALSSFTRATPATIRDNYGTIQHCKAGEARFPGCRRVENLVSSDLATWTRTGLEVVRIDEGYRLFNIELGSRAQSGTFETTVDELYIFSFEARVVDDADVGKTFKSAMISDGGDTDIGLVTLDGEWRRYSIGAKQMIWGGTTYVSLSPDSGDILGTVEIRNTQVEKMQNSVFAYDGTPYVYSPSEFVSLGEGDGPNLVDINGTWTVNQSTYSVVDGELVHTVTGVGGNGLSASFPTTVGRSYQVSATVRSGAENLKKFARIFVDLTVDFQVETISDDEEYTTTVSGTFVAESATHTLELMQARQGAGEAAYLDKAFWSDILVSEITPTIHGSNVDGVAYYDTDNPLYLGDGDIVLRGVLTETNAARNLMKNPITPIIAETLGWSKFGASGGGSVTFNSTGAKERGLPFVSADYYSGLVATGYGPATKKELIAGETYYVTLYFYPLGDPEGASTTWGVCVENVTDADHTTYWGVFGSVALWGTEDAGAVTNIVEKRIYKRSVGTVLYEITFELVPDTTSIYKIGAGAPAANLGSIFFYPVATFVSDTPNIEFLANAYQGNAINAQFEPRIASGQQLVEFPTDATQWDSYSGGTQTDQGDTAYRGIFKRVAIESAGGAADGYQVNGASTLNMSVGDLVAVEAFVEAGTSGELRVVFRDIVNGASALVEFDLVGG